MAYESFVPIIGTIINISGGTDCCSQMISIRAENGIINFLVDPGTLVIDDRQLRAGMRVAAFYDSSLPVPLIFPPQYRAQIVTMLNRNEMITLKYFNRNLIASDQSLQINPASTTAIVTVNGQPFNCNPGNQNLLVYYSMTTRSIPPQTTPRRIVVLC